MKKIALFMAFASLGFASCSNDDDKGTTTLALNSAYLNGIWTETAPDPGNYTLVFNGTTAQLNREGESSDSYNYTVTESGLRFTLQENSESFSIHEAEIVNSTTLKLSNMYIQTADAGNTPVITTFKKQ